MLFVVGLRLEAERRRLFKIPVFANIDHWRLVSNPLKHLDYFVETWSGVYLLIVRYTGGMNRSHLQACLGSEVGRSGGPVN